MMGQTEELKQMSEYRPDMKLTIWHLGLLICSYQEVIGNFEKETTTS